MKKAIIPLMCFFLAINLASQDKENVKIKFTSLFQYIMDYSQSSLNQNLGKTEVGTLIEFNKFISFRLIYKVYSDFSVEPFDVFAEIKPLKSVSFKIGQFKSPNSLENISAPDKRDFVVESILTKYLSTRDFGIGSDIKIKNLECNLAIFNGEGLNKKDQNKYKDIILRTAFNTSNVTIGGVYYYGRSGLEEDITQYRVLNFHAQLKFDFHYHIVFEISSLKYLNELNSEKHSYYLAGGYFIPLDSNQKQYLEALLRWEFESNDFTSQQNQPLTIGLNYYFDKNYDLRIQLNYMNDLKKKDTSKIALGLLYSLN